MLKTIAGMIMVISIPQILPAEKIDSPTEIRPEIALEAPFIEYKKVLTDPLFEKIAFCESKNDPAAKNPGSSAKGRFQFLDGTWKGYAPRLWGDDWINKNVLDYEDNTELAWYVYTHYGTSDWEADPKSYNCWKSEIPNGKYKRSAV